MHRLMTGLVVVLAALGSSTAAEATVLGFHDGSVSGPVLTGPDLNCISANSAGCYGDRASGPTSPLGTLYSPNGDTPNISLTYTGAFRQWNNGFGTSTYLGSDNSDPSYLTFTADAGYAVQLSSITLDIVDGFLGGNVDIFTGGVPGSGATPLLSLAISGTTPVTTALALIASSFTIKLPSQNFGLQALSFQQVAATPIPAALPLFGSALAGLGALAWRRKKTAKAA
jgi:hypothetical protein